MGDNEVYGQLKPVVSVSLLGFRVLPEDLPFHTVFQLTERNSPEDVLTQDCVLHYLELPKLDPDLDTELGQWLYALKSLEYKEDPKMRVLLERNHNLYELADRYKKFDSDERARMAYLDREKYLRDQANLIHTAKSEGLEEGGEKKQKEIIARMKALGLDAATISKATGIPVEDL